MSSSSKQGLLQKRLKGAQGPKGSSQQKGRWTLWFVLIALTLTILIGVPLFLGARSTDTREQYSELLQSSNTHRSLMSKENIDFIQSESKPIPSSTVKAKEKLKPQRNQEELRASFALVMEAVDRGTPESLKVIAPEVLSENKDFYQQNADRLLEVLLQGVLTRFQMVDWAGWHGTPDDEREFFTPAQDYISNVNSQNPQLAATLNAVAKVFHELYLSVAELRAFDLKAAWIAEKPEFSEPVIDRWSGESEALELFADDLTKEAAFIRVFRQYQNMLTLRKVSTRNLELDSAFELIFFLNPDSLLKADRAKLAMLITSLTENATPLQRSMLFSNTDMSKLQEFARADGDPLSKAIAELYALRAVDALEVDQPQVASEMLQLSLSSNKGLPVQAKLAKHISSPASVVVASDAQTKKAKTSKVSDTLSSNSEDLFGDLGEESESKPAGEENVTTRPEKSEAPRSSHSADSSFSFFSIIPLALIVLVSFFVVMYVLHRREARRASEFARSTSQQRHEEEYQGDGREPLNP